jgi:hypothetical protein
MTTMKPRLLRGASLLLPMLLAACGHDKQALDHANVAKAMTSYFEKHGDLCLAKSEWPIDVAPEERRAGSRNALQMPVLERLGLVESSTAIVERSAGDGSPSRVNVLRYRLTALGNQYYLARAPHKYPSTNRYASVGRDLCAARLSLDKIVGWELVANQAAGARPEAVVTYTYKVAPAPWTADPGVRQVFPVVANIVKGASVLQLQETLVLADGLWEAKDL